MLSTINGPSDRLLFSMFDQTCNYANAHDAIVALSRKYHPFHTGKSSGSNFLSIRYVMEFSDGFPVCAQFCFISIMCNSLWGWFAMLWIGCIMRFSRCAAHVFVGLKCNMILRFSVGAYRYFQIK